MPKSEPIGFAKFTCRIIKIPLTCWGRGQGKGAPHRNLMQRHHTAVELVDTVMARRLVQVADATSEQLGDEPEGGRHADGKH